MSRIVVTGIGAISAIGETIEEQRKALVNGQTGISTLSQFPSRFSGVLPCGEIKKTTAELKQELSIADPAVTRTSLLAVKAMSDALKDAGLTSNELQSNDTALIGASTVGGMCLTDELYQDSNNKLGEGSVFVHSYDNSSVSLFLQQQFRIGGMINTINTACSSSANAIMYGARLIQQGLAKRAIVGGADSLAKFTINGFNSLHILSSSPCRPFDAARNGLNLGEAAGFLVLEKEEDAQQKKIYATVSGYGNSNDSYHASSISDEGEGPYLCMQRALTVAQLSPSSIQCINAHGTATENNDETESRAMMRLFDNVPAFLSTKSYTGHTLGAAGAIEAIFSILSLQYQEVYGSLRFDQPIASTALIPEQSYRSMKIDHIMSNSFGFGGNCTSLIFSKENK